MSEYYIVYFVILSFIGYIYECIAMTLWTGKWDNRGFLYGPIIPIYGFGAFIGLMLFGGVFKNYTPFLVFLTGTIMSAILEYPTSILLEKVFHAYWWDYYDLPFNLNGRISLFSSLGFGLGALLIVYVINPTIWPWLLKLNNTFIKILSYVLIGLIGADITLTICALSSLDEKVEIVEKIVDKHMSEKVESINPKGKKIKDVIRTVDEGVEAIHIKEHHIYDRAILKIKGFKQTGSEKILNIKIKIKERIGNRKKDER